MTSAEPEGDLLARVRAGDERAFATLVRKHGPLVRRAASRVTRGHPRTEDVMQDAFMHVFRHVDGFEGRSSFGSWLFRIAINAALMERRSARRYSEAIRSAASVARDGGDAFGRPSRGVEDIVRDRELARHAAAAVDELPEPDRSVFIRTALDQAPLAVVADELALSVSAVKSRLCRTRSALRRALARALDVGNGPGPMRGDRSSY